MEKEKDKVEYLCVVAMAGGERGKRPDWESHYNDLKESASRDSIHFCSPRSGAQWFLSGILLHHLFSWILKSDSSIAIRNQVMDYC